MGSGQSEIWTAGWDPRKSCCHHLLSLNTATLPPASPLKVFNRSDKAHPHVEGRLFTQG